MVAVHAQTVAQRSRDAFCPAGHIGGVKQGYT
jgi:hypothetical protein